MCLSTPAFHGSLWNGCLCGVSCFKTCQGIPSEDYWAFWILFFFFFFLFIGTLNLHLHCSYPPLAATSIVNTLESVLLQHRESSSAASPQKFKHNSFISLADMYLCFGTSLEPLKKNALINMQSGLLELFLQPCCHVNPSLLRWTVSWKASLVFPEESKEI